MTESVTASSVQMENNIEESSGLYMCTSFRRCERAW